jgi:hypothetical protein
LVNVFGLVCGFAALPALSGLHFPEIVRVVVSIGVGVASVFMATSAVKWFDATVGTYIPPECTRATESPNGVTLWRPELLGSRPRVFYAPVRLRRSLALRVKLRERFRLTLDLGDDSPEVLRPGDPPIAEWQPAASLPEPSETETGGVYRLNASGPRVVRAKSDAAAARAARKQAGIAATVVDEAAIDDTHLYVQEEGDFGSMDLSLLRSAAPLDDGSVAFSFGKFTTVVFVEAKDNAVVAALRERLRQKRESTPAAAQAFEEVEEVEEAGLGARPKSTAR